MTATTTDDPDYTVWESIDYQPAITDLLPRRLLEFLRPSSRVLDAGCNTGGVALFLADRGHSCTGIDINPDAIAEAVERASRHRLSGTASFKVADLGEFSSPERFDAVLMIRLLTCVPKIDHWRANLNRAFALLRPGGLIYIHDFVYDPESPVYRSRYAQGRTNGWRDGNFPVYDDGGRLLFVAHHHSAGDLAEIFAPYDTVLFEQHVSLSMNGNPCRMFEFIGRKHHDSTAPQASPMTSVPAVQGRDSAPPPIDAALAGFESRYGVHFARFVVYPKAFLDKLHQAAATPGAGFRLQVATQRDPSLLRHFQTFSEVANAKDPSVDLRSRYFDGLRAVYAALDQTPARFLADEAVGFVAPEREGRILAQKMGWQPSGRSFHPNAKRIAYEGGMLVALTGFEVERSFERVEIIDGAIASGATLMAVMERMATSSRVIDIYSVHATAEGLNALSGFARLRNLELSVFVGHVTAGLNDHFYATEADGSRLVVGDLGDTISDLPEAGSP